MGGGGGEETQSREGGTEKVTVQISRRDPSLCPHRFAGCQWAPHRSPALSPHHVICLHPSSLPLNYYFFFKKYFLKILFVCYGTLYLTHFKTVKIKKIIHLILVLKFIISPHFSILWYPFSACNFFCIFLLKKKVSCDRSFRWDRMVRWKAYIYYYFCINHRYSVEFYPVD